MVSPSSLFQSFDLDISVVSYSIVWCFIVALYVDCSSRLRCDASLFYVYFCGRLFVKFFTIHYWAQLGYFFFFGTNISYYFVTLSSLPPFWISFRIPCLILFRKSLKYYHHKGNFSFPEKLEVFSSPSNCKRNYQSHLKWLIFYSGNKRLIGN